MTAEGAGWNQKSIISNLVIFEISAVNGSPQGPQETLALELQMYLLNPAHFVHKYI